MTMTPAAPAVLLLTEPPVLCAPVQRPHRHPRPWAGCVGSARTGAGIKVCRCGMPVRPCELAAL